jgi:hypothetical protein
MTPTMLASCGPASRPHPNLSVRGVPRIFLLSPANTSSIRGRLLLNKDSTFELAQQIRREGVPLGDVFSFISSLYFRGKLAYGNAFSNPPSGLPGVLIMTTSRGLIEPNTVISFEDLTEMSGVPIDLSDARYREPICRDARALARRLPSGSQVVLLGSIASRKYVDPLVDVFAEDLQFPEKFVGRGDMSRGGLMLRCVDAQVELDYVPVATTVRRGIRPPKLSARIPRLP